MTEDQFKSEEEPTADQSHDGKVSEGASDSDAVDRSSRKANTRDGTGEA
jgi:hypothetical protein